MTQSTLELYLYMGSIEPIIEWLKKEGVKTKEEARQKLAPLVRNNMFSVASHIGGSLAGTANGAEKILKAFPEK